MSEAKSILSALQTANRIVVVAHKSPDGDSIGSSMALYHHPQKMGKRRPGGASRSGARIFTLGT